MTAVTLEQCRRRGWHSHRRPTPMGVRRGMGAGRRGGRTDGRAGEVDGARRAARRPRPHGLAACGATRPTGTDARPPSSHRPRTAWRRRSCTTWGWFRPRTDAVEMQPHARRPSRARCRTTSSRSASSSARPDGSLQGRVRHLARADGQPPRGRPRTARRGPAGAVGAARRHVQHRSGRGARAVARRRPGPRDPPGVADRPVRGAERGRDARRSPRSQETDSEKYPVRLCRRRTRSRP